jgi:hypothetical protein
MTQTEEEEPETVIDTDRARGGVTGHHVRYVLAFGLGGLVAAFIILAFVY